MDCRWGYRGAWVTALLMVLLWPAALRATDDVAGTLVEVNDNGGWCWYEGERALIQGGRLIVGSVAAAAGAGGATRSGNIEVSSWEFDTGQIRHFVLHANLQADDHDSPALLVRPDGRYLAMYARHGSDNYSRWRISINPGDITAWGPEQTFDHGTGCTYSNLYRLPPENGGAGRVYNLARTIGIDPNVLVSDDDGQTWSYGGRLLNWPVPTGDPKFTGSDGSRPYLRYASNGVNEIHFITTEDHPRAYDNSIYHGVICGGKVYDSFGNVVDDNLFDGNAMRPNQYTSVFNTDVSPLGFAWTTDLRLDAQGRPYALCTARANNSDSTDHRFLYARFDGVAWNVHEIAKAGGYLYATENDYTGLGALDPRDPNTLYISTKINPGSGSSLAHYEIFKGVTTDGGASWTWTWITSNSTMDNLRPIVPPSDGPQEALLWLRGSFSTYTDYNLRVVALASAAVPACSTVTPVTVATPLRRGATTVTVTGVDPAATAVTVYAFDPGPTTQIGTAPANGTSTVQVSVPPLLPGQAIVATQTLSGAEGCIPATGPRVPALQIVYVDADPNTNGTNGNTTINGSRVNTGTGGNATTGTSGGPGSDNKWHVRSRTTVNGDEVWEAGSAEAPPVLITTLSIPPGTYDLYGLFWNNASNAGLWDIQFRVGPSGSFTTFDKSNGILAAADGSEFANNVITRDDAGNYQVLLIAPLGRFEVAGPVDVYVSTPELSATGDDRTWYDGLGYALVCNFPFADVNGDDDVDQQDFGAFQACFSGQGPALGPGCACFDRPQNGPSGDGAIDGADLEAFINCFTGPSVSWSQAPPLGCVP